MRLLTRVFLIILALLSLQYLCNESVTAQSKNKKLSISFNNIDTTTNKFINESVSGSPILASRTYYIVVPPANKIIPQLVDVKDTVLNNFKLSINPSVVLRNDTTLGYSKEQLKEKYFDGDYYPKNEIELTGYTWIKNYYCAVVKVNFQRYNWRTKTIRQIQSASINYPVDETQLGKIKAIANETEDNALKKLILNFDDAKNYSYYKPTDISRDSTGSWIDYNREHIKLSVIKDGIYKITYDDLLGIGINPSSINPKTFRMFCSGNELPIYINGEDDLVFNNGDYIEFYGEKNYGSKDYKQIAAKGVDYKNYMNMYTDTSIVWLTWDGDHGKRASISKLNSSLTVDTIKSCLATIHLEQDKRLWYYDAVEPRVQLPTWQENKVWTWLATGSSGSQSATFQANNVLPNSIVKSCVRLISYAADIQTKAHKNGVSINSTNFQDTLSYDFRQTVNLSTKYPSSVLKEGSNTFRIFGIPTKASYHQSLVDWIDIEYFKKNNADNDTLIITIPDSVGRQVRAIKISNVKENSENILIYKIKPDVKKFENISQNKSANEIVFIDTVKGGDKYILTKSSCVIKPLIVGKKSFRNLRNKNNGADYIIITNKTLLQSSTQYQKFIEVAYGIRTKLIDVTDIYDEFSYGMMSAESIREFLLYAYDNWTLPQPGYLLIIGDANYDYKDVYTPAPTVRKKNLVPSYGFPVSDVWYVTNENSSVPSQNMCVGRIPAQNDEQVLSYLERHKNYISRGYDGWNKNYILFSGGDATKTSELAEVKAVNDSVLAKIISPKPIGGVGNHFYKTISPSSNFGPYTSDYYQSVIDTGAVVISYVGHSGTQTWDNGITQTEDIKNAYSNRYPLISDFGCSTGKFAEPDVDAFGELFIAQNSRGQAINYLGNSSWGYLSTSTRFPILFYSELLKNSDLTIGRAHSTAKLLQFQESGISDVAKVFYYCNLLFGDPIISLKIPSKPNLAFDVSSTKIIEDNPNDQEDSVHINIKIKNLGNVPENKLDVKITDQFNSSIIYTLIKTLNIPFNQYKLNVSIPVKNKAGSHHLKFELDYQNKIEELNEIDNILEYDVQVYSSSLKNIEADNNYLTSKNYIYILNPSLEPNTKNSSIQVSISTDRNYSESSLLERNLDLVVTKIPLTNLIDKQRYFWKMKLNGSNIGWSETYSFQNIKGAYKWYYDNSLESKDLLLNFVEYDSLKKAFILSKHLNKIKIVSAGYNAGDVGSIKFNNEEVLPKTYFWGIATALIDTIDLHPYSYRYFLYPFETSGDQLKKYIDSLAYGTTIALTICDDGAQSALGWSANTSQRLAIETLGSQYIRSVGYRESWCMIGKKGAAKGSVPEVYKKIDGGIASIEISKSVTSGTGYILFPYVSNSVKWKNVFASIKIPSGAELSLIPIGINKEATQDTLNALVIKDSLAALTSIDAKKYSSLRLLAKYKANSQKESPELKSIGVDYDTFPELVINYQVVSISKDTLEQGENVDLSFYVYNVGESKAEKFKVAVDLVKTDNSGEKIFETVVDSLGSNQKKLFNVSYLTSNIAGANQFNIRIDTENNISELYKDNNYYSVPYYVKENTKPATLRLTFDGNDIIDGDFISPNPNIKVELNDQSLIPIHDTLAVQLYLNNKRIYFLNNPAISYSYASANPKFVLDYRPTLENGSYTLKVLGKNASGQLIDSTGVLRKFSVQNELQLVEAYNYPNPFASETYFTFKLTQIPDELNLKIFTVAGRMVKEFHLTSSEIKYDFNRIYWDGRDTDGDLVANGIYLYKIILKKGSETTQTIQKLAVVR